MYSDGGRLRCGTSLRASAPKLLVEPPDSDGAQPKPASIITIFSVGKRSNTPSQHEACQSRRLLALRDLVPDHPR